MAQRRCDDRGGASSRDPDRGRSGRRRCGDDDPVGDGKGTGTDRQGPQDLGMRKLTSIAVTLAALGHCGRVPGRVALGDCSPKGRVRRRRYPHPLPSELHVKVSPHAAQAFRNGPEINSPLHTDSETARTMNTPFDRSALRRRGFILLWLIAASQAMAAEGEAPRSNYSPTERMTPARLKAAHEDVLRIGLSRRPPPAIPGLIDYRAILHAHAEDSAHTGGTRTEMLAAAKRAGVHAILLTDHYRPPKDFVADSWRGLREGVLFLPGCEDRGFLIYPTRSIIDRMKDATPTFIETVRSDGGLIFLSHIEERPDHSMAGLDGMEISNRHADAKVDSAGIVSLMLKLTDSAS